ncbi:MAG: hydroxyacid-oxoacid transhydrogenase, partial [Myxococcota bacterium]
MACCHLYDLIEGNENAFSVDTNAITFGRGCLAEIGQMAKQIGLSTVALMTDRQVATLELLQTVLRSLKTAGVDVELYAEVRVEPTDTSFRDAVKFASDGRFDGYISLGGGSVIDTAKAANLFATHPADFLDYVNAPVGAGRAVPGPLKPHIACPTTSGTGSECTGIAVFDFVELGAKTGIAHRYLKPTRALIDPAATDTLPGYVVAASGFDVLSHALESYTARPFTHRGAQETRPMSQGANPWSDIGCREALRLCGHHLVRATVDADDREAREKMMWASTLAGIAFGNAGVHVPHGMAYAVAGLVKSYRPPSYPGDEPMVPHGVSVIVNAPAVFRMTAPTHPERHLEAA